MKQWIGLALLVFVGTAGWRIGSSLSPDALSMAVGVLFGVMAGVPTALLVMASGRRRRRDDEERNERRQAAAAHPAAWGPAGYFPPPQPPVIVLTGQAGAQGQMNSGWSAPGSRVERRFKVVGEQEQWAEEW